MKQLALAIMLALPIMGDSPTHRFQVWETLSRTEKFAVYLGWTNGFVYSGSTDAARWIICINRLSEGQAIAMIDKYFNDHPEKWSDDLTVGILNALAVKGGPCETK